VAVPKHVYLTGRGLNAEWKGDLSVHGNYQNPDLKGTLQLVKGDVNLFGRSFTLTQGTITFGGKATKNTNIFVIAQFDVAGYNVKAILQGPITAPEITFQSSPPLPPTEILSRILFGSSVSQISPIQGVQLANALITLSGTFEGPDILGNLQHGLGLDQLTIVNAEDTLSGDTVSVLQAGKYLSEGVYVCIDKTLTGDQNNVGFEARLINDFRVRVDVKENEENTLLLEWKHDY
jgi:translocation and assembly module TamB